MRPTSRSPPDQTQQRLAPIERVITTDRTQTNAPYPASGPKLSNQTAVRWRCCKCVSLPHGTAFFFSSCGDCWGMPHTSVVNNCPPNREGPFTKPLSETMSLNLITLVSDSFCLHSTHHPHHNHPSRLIPSGWLQFSFFRFTSFHPSISNASVFEALHLHSSWTGRRGT